jgi:hypothetical protein
VIKLWNILWRNSFIWKHLRSFLKVFLFVVERLPHRKERLWLEETPFFKYVYIHRMEAIRIALNTSSVIKRDDLAQAYIVPAVNILFDKNYINEAQYLLFTIEEWFLSQNTEKEFEEKLKLFAQHAIDAGLRFREKFPLPETGKHEPPRIAFASHWVGKIGFEVIIGLGRHLRQFSPLVYGMFAYNPPGEVPTTEVFRRNGLKVVVRGEENTYNAFALRQLFGDHPVDIAMWVTPPMHMFFNFSFGLAPKQVFFSQYLHPNIEFKYLDSHLTLGGAGKIVTKTFNGREWDIIPQVTYIESTTREETDQTVMFSPARLEKIKQPPFLYALKQIMIKCPNAVYKWTGYYQDPELLEFFSKNGWSDRHWYIPWMNNTELLREISTTDVILGTFPIDLGTTGIMASLYSKPIVSMYSQSNPLYWRDCYWEAEQGNAYLRGICLDKNGKSILSINSSIDDYVNDAVDIINNPAAAARNAKAYKDAFDYTYLNNPNDIGEIFGKYVDKLYREGQ